MFCAAVFFIQCIKFFIKYLRGVNLLSFNQSQLRIKPNITTGDFFYKILFVAPSASAFRVSYTIAKYFAGKSLKPKYSLADRFSVFLLNTILGSSFWNLIVCIIVADQLLQICQQHKKSQVFAILRARIVILMYTEFNLSLAYVSQLRIYKKHNIYIFNPKDILYDLKKIALIKCFSPNNLIHYALTYAPEPGRALLVNIITHKPLPGVSSWQINPGDQPSFATGNAIFSGSYKETSLSAVAKLQAIGLDKNNLGGLYFKIALSEQLNLNGVVARVGAGNIIYKNINRYQYALQNSEIFPPQALKLEQIIHEKLSLAEEHEKELLRLELELIQNAGVNACPPRLVKLLKELNLYNISIQGLLDQL